MNQAYIIQEIHRTAKENGGKPLGRMKFTSETGIKASDWFGIYWTRWSDALREADFSASKFGTAYDKDELLTKYADLVQELDRLPIDAEVRLKTRTDKTFPSHSTLARLGTKVQLAAQLLVFCEERNGYHDVVKVEYLVIQPLQL